MTEQEHLAEALEAFFADRGNYWHAPFTEAVRGLTAQDAARAPGPGLHSVWDLVGHIRFCHELVHHLIEGRAPDRTEAPADWPAVADPTDEAAWALAVEQAVAANRALVAAVRALPEERLGLEGNWVQAPLRLLHGLIAHNSYHIGQMVLTRRRLEQWRELQWMEGAE